MYILHLALKMTQTPNDDPNSTSKVGDIGKSPRQEIEAGRRLSRYTDDRALSLTAPVAAASRKRIQHFRSNAHTKTNTSQPLTG